MDFIARKVPVKINSLFQNKDRLLARKVEPGRKVDYYLAWIKHVFDRKATSLRTYFESHNDRDVNQLDPLLGMNATHIAVELKFADVVEELVERLHADVNTTTSTGRTCLMLAVIGGNVELFTFLLIYGSNLNAQDQFGCSALHYCILKQSVNMLDRLLELGANPKLIDSSGYPILHHTVILKSIPMIEMVLKYSGSLTAVDKEERTALHIAVLLREEAIAEMLIKKGIDTKAQDSHAKSALVYAEEQKLSANLIEALTSVKYTQKSLKEAESAPEISRPETADLTAASKVKKSNDIAHAPPIVAKSVFEMSTANNAAAIVLTSSKTVIKEPNLMSSIYVSQVSEASELSDVSSLRSSEMASSQDLNTAITYADILPVPSIQKPESDYSTQLDAAIRTLLDSLQNQNVILTRLRNNSKGNDPDELDLKLLLKSSLEALVQKAIHADAMREKLERSGEEITYMTEKHTTENQARLEEVRTLTAALTSFKYAAEQEVQSYKEQAAQAQSARAEIEENLFQVQRERNNFATLLETGHQKLMLENAEIDQLRDALQQSFVNIESLEKTNAELEESYRSTYADKIESMQKVIDQQSAKIQQLNSEKQSSTLLAASLQDDQLKAQSDNQSLISELENLNTELEEKISSEKEEISALKMKIMELEITCKGFQAQKARLQIILEGAENRITELSAELTKTQENFKAQELKYENQIANLESDKTETSRAYLNQIKSLEEDNQDLQSRIESEKSRIENLKLQKARLELSFSGMQAQKSRSNFVLEDQEAQLSELTAQLTKKQSEYKSLYEELQSVKNQNSNLLNDIRLVNEALDQAFLEIKSLSESKEKAESLSKTLQSHYTQLSEDLKEKSILISGIQSELVAKDMALCDAEEALTQAEKEWQEERDRMTHLEEQRSTLATAHGNERRKSITMHQNLGAMISQLEEEKELRRSAEESIRVMSESVKALEKALDKNTQHYEEMIQEKVTEVTDIYLKLKASQDLVKSIRDELVEVRKSGEITLQEALVTHRAILHQQEVENSALKEEIGAIQKKFKTSELRAEAELSQLQTHLRAITSESASYQQKLAAKNEDLNRLMSSLRQEKTDLLAVRVKVEDLERDKIALEHTIKSLAIKNNNDNELHTQALNALKEEKTQMSRILDETKSRLEATAVAKDEAAQSIRELRKLLEASIAKNSELDSFLLDFDREITSTVEKASQPAEATHISKSYPSSSLPLQASPTFEDVIQTSSTQIFENIDTINCKISYLRSALEKRAGSIQSLLSRLGPAANGKLSVQSILYKLLNQDNNVTHVATVSLHQSQVIVAQFGDHISHILQKIQKTWSSQQASQNEQIKDLEVQLKSSQDRLIALQDLIDNTHQSHVKVTFERNQLVAECEVLKSSIEATEAGRALLTVKLKETEEKLSTLRAELQDLEKIKTIQQTTLDQNQEIILRLSNKCDTLQAQCFAYQDQIVAGQELLREKMMALSAKEFDNERFATQLDQQNNRIDQAKVELHTLEQQNREAEKQIVVYRKQSEKLTELLATKSDEIQSLKDTAQRMTERHQEDSESLVLELKKVKSTSSELSSKLVDIQIQADRQRLVNLQKSQFQESEWKSERQRLETQYRDLESVLKDREGQLIQSAAKVDSIQQALSEAQRFKQREVEDMANLQGQVQKLTSRINELSAEKERNNTILHKAKVELEEYRTVKDLNRQFIAQITTLQTECSELKVASKNATDDLALYKEKTKELRHSFDNRVQELSKTIHDAESNVTTRQTQLTKLQHDLKSMQSEIQVKTSQIIGLQADLKRAQENDSGNASRLLQELSEYQHQLSSTSQAYEQQTQLLLQLQETNAKLVEVNVSFLAERDGWERNVRELREAAFQAQQKLALQETQSLCTTKELSELVERLKVKKEQSDELARKAKAKYKEKLDAKCMKLAAQLQSVIVKGESLTTRQAECEAEIEATRSEHARLLAIELEGVKRKVNNTNNPIPSQSLVNIHASAQSASEMRRTVLHGALQKLEATERLEDEIGRSLQTLKMINSEVV